MKMCCCKRKSCSSAEQCLGLHKSGPRFSLQVGLEHSPLWNSAELQPVNADKIELYWTNGQAQSKAAYCVPKTQLIWINLWTQVFQAWDPWPLVLSYKPYNVLSEHYNRKSFRLRGLDPCWPTRSSSFFISWTKSLGSSKKSAKIKCENKI